MIIKCAWHPERYGVELVMGVKEPYDDGYSAGIKDCIENLSCLHENTKEK